LVKNSTFEEKLRKKIESQKSTGHQMDWVNCDKVQWQQGT